MDTMGSFCWRCWRFLEQLGVFLVVGTKSSCLGPVRIRTRWFSVDWAAIVSWGVIVVVFFFLYFPAVGVAIPVSLVVVYR